VDGEGGQVESANAEEYGHGEAHGHDEEHLGAVINTELKGHI